MVIDGVPLSLSGSRIGMITFNERGADTSFGFAASAQLRGSQSLSAAIVTAGLPGQGAASEPPAAELLNRFHFPMSHRHDD